MKFTKVDNVFTIIFENRKYNLNDLEDYKIKTLLCCVQRFLLRSYTIVKTSWYQK